MERKKLKHWFSSFNPSKTASILILHIKSSNDPSSALLLKYRSISNKIQRLTRLDTQQYSDHMCASNILKIRRSFGAG